MAPNDCFILDNGVDAFSARGILLSEIGILIG